MFSGLQKNEFYATGESYAGKYVPAISYKIHQMNKAATTKPRINFKVRMEDFITEYVLEVIYFMFS